MQKRVMIAVSMRAEECPFIPPRPGNLWVGYVDPKDFFYEVESHKDTSLEEVLTSKLAVMLSNDAEESLVLYNTWIVGTMINTFQDKVDGRNAVNFAINQTSFVAPITDYADLGGITMCLSLKGRTCLVLDHQTRSAIENDIDRARRRLVSARSRLVVPKLA